MSMPPTSKSSAPNLKKAVVLPDHVFFTRVVSLAPGASPAEVPAQVEMALEGLSPFPAAQLCHGYFHAPGAERVLVYAAYRRRFTVDDAAAWSEADAVLPAFAACLGLPPAGRRALLVAGPEWLTALGWDGRDAVPVLVMTRPIAPEATPEERAAVRTELTAHLKGFPDPIEVAAPSGTDSRLGDDGLEFTLGALTVRFDSEHLDALDVRDKAELAGRRRERARNLLFWRVFMGCAAALALAILLEAGMAGGRLWLKSRSTITAAQAPAVQVIETKHNLANRIEELSTRRLMPIRMLEIVNEKRPRTVQFLRTTTKGLYALEIEGQTNATPDVFNYEAALRELPACARVELGQTADRGGITRFILTVTFKPEALRPPAPSS
jgi:hypothetical protein